jgi:hypothetical protein
MMIKDKKRREWRVRYRQSRYGWTWNARWKNLGQQSDRVPFATKALAETDAQQRISNSDAVAEAREFFRQFQEDQRKTEL